jgi:hypothetical protein
MGMLGGVEGTQVSSNTFQVTARGNGYTDPDSIERFVLRKAAEMTLSNGFDYFIIEGEQDRSRTTEVAGSYASYHRGIATGFGYRQSILHPGATVMVQAFKGPLPNPPPPGAFEAKDVLHYAAIGSGYVPPAPGGR